MQGALADSTQVLPTSPFALLHSHTVRQAENCVSARKDSLLARRRLGKFVVGGTATTRRHRLARGTRFQQDTIEATREDDNSKFDTADRARILGCKGERAARDHLSVLELVRFLTHEDRCFVYVVLAEPQRASLLENIEPVSTTRKSISGLPPMMVCIARASLSVGSAMSKGWQSSICGPMRLRLSL